MAKERECVRPVPRSCLLSRRSPWQPPLAGATGSAQAVVGVPLPSVSVPSVPVPLPSVSVPAVPVPTPTVPSVPSLPGTPSLPGGGGGGGGNGGSGDDSAGGSGGPVGSGSSTVSGSQDQASPATRAARKKAAKRQADATPMIAGTKAAENLVDDESSPELYEASQSFLTADQGIAEIARQKQVMARLKQDATTVAHLYRAMGYDVAGAERVATAWHQRYDGLAPSTKTGERRMVGGQRHPRRRAARRRWSSAARWSRRSSSSSPPGTPRRRRRWPTPAPGSPRSPRNGRPR